MKIHQTRKGTNHEQHVILPHPELRPQGNGGVIKSRPVDREEDEWVAVRGGLCYIISNQENDMSITATVEDGKITLPSGTPWPSGTVVRIEPVAEQPPTLWDTLKEFDGMAKDLPGDLAANLDHYVHGHPRS